MCKRNYAALIKENVFLFEEKGDSYAGSFGTVEIDL